MSDRVVLKLCIIFFAYLVLCVQIAIVSATENSNPSEAGNVPEILESPFETQTAQCTITSGDIEASAQASISKTLVGVCGSDEMITAFRTLEAKMLQEMSNLRRMIREPYFNPPPLLPSVYRTIKHTTTSNRATSDTKLFESTSATTEMAISIPSAAQQQMNVTTTSTYPEVVFPDDDYEDEEEEKAVASNNIQASSLSNSDLVKEIVAIKSQNTSLITRVSDDDLKNTPAAPAIAFKPIDKPIEKKFLIGGLRDYEVYRFNNTVISSGDAKVFKYFWKIEQFTKKVRAAAATGEATFSSAVFVISGLNLRLHARTAKKTVYDVLFVQLEQLSSSDYALRKTPNVILASGSLYGQVETSSFFRHKIVILNQDEPFSDLISTDLTNTNTRFEAPLSFLTKEPYLKDDKLLIKVVIFL